jgi:hypothetical protein
MIANSARGETAIAGHVLRPSFAALVAAEEELGPLFALVERAAIGQLKLSEMVALFWHCVVDQSTASREDFADAVVAGGLAGATPALKCLLGQILGGFPSASQGLD